MADESEAAPEAEPEAEAEPAAEPEAGAEPDAAAPADGDDPAASLGLEGSAEEDAAAAKLQAMQRGKADRKKVEGLKIEILFSRGPCGLALVHRARIRSTEHVGAGRQLARAPPPRVCGCLTRRRCSPKQS